MTTNRVSVRLSTFALLIALFLTPGGAAAQGSVELKAAPSAPKPHGRPTELEMRRAGSSSRDLRTLPRTRPRKEERPEREEPPLNPVELPGFVPQSAPLIPVVAAAAAPPPIANFPGLDFATWGNGHPPDTVGDVGPVYYIQAINTSLGIFRKSDGVRVAALGFNTFMSQGNFGNLCDTNNFGDPVILYDSFEDRWVITDFAFQLSGGAVVNPPGAFQCFAISKTGDPVTGGWNFYSLNITDALNDYPKLGIWPDGIYMAANMFGFPAGGSFMGSRVWAFNKAQMYAGEPTVQVVSFNAPVADFTLLPSNARLQTGTPPPGTPNYFVSTWEFLNALTVYKLHVDWDKISTSTFTGPDTPMAATSWPNAAVPNAPSQGGNNLDVLQIRAMMQNQYSNIGGVESLWVPHTVRRQNTSGFAAPRWYQVNVTGGTVAANLPQAATWDPDGANVMYRFMPSLAVDRAGDMALGYSTSNTTTKPAIKYAGRLAGDPINTFSQTEQLLFQGTGTQTGTCGGSTCIRWGDYSAMSLDPDGCTFWYTNMHYLVDGLNHQTQIGSFAYPSCTPVGAGGTLSGTVTATLGGAPISGATINFGSRTTTTNGSGFYSFSNVPAGTYPSETASAPGYNSSTATNIIITDGNTTTQDFSLDTTPPSACLTDTTQTEFQRGVPANTDLTTSPGDVKLVDATTIDQQNTTLGTSGVGITVTTWGGQTFTPTITGPVTQVDINLFCSGCTGTTPNLTLSLRATSGGLPTGADLASATITGFNNGAAVFYTATFGSPIVLTAGTQYAIVIRPTANPSPGTYALTRSGTATLGANVYAGGTRVSGATSGTVWSIPTTGGVTTDAGFKVYVRTGFASGNFVSSPKDSNPAIGFYPLWTTLSWNATTPAGTTLQFQVAGSNNSFGLFNFVGPDNTAATFFTTSGASLSQFNGFRYLKYKAYLTTTDNTMTPSVTDVTACYDVVTPDLSITKTDGVTTAVPGGSVVYTITAANPSSAPATGATVADTFPAILTCTWTCAGAGGGTCTAAGSGNINDTVNLPAGASVTYTATCSIAAAATGTLSNTATVTIAADPNTANNSATDTDTLTPQADLAVTKTDGVTTATPGGSVTYTITASNPGPSDAPGAMVADTFPAALTCTWTCVGAGGGTCTASGSGNVNDTVNLPSGGSVTYTASCTISSGATGTLSNTATVAAPGGVTDPTPGNSSATDTDTLNASADLSITKTDGVTTATAGGSVTYTITASNPGPSDAPGAMVADTFSAALTCTWTCAGAGGGTCTASGSGNVNDTVNLPAGGSVTYTASCTISPSATGSLSNTATVTAPGGVTDPTPGNDSATDIDGLGATADVAVTKTDGVTTATPGGSVTYTITASNSGPSDAPGSTVADTFPASLTCTWTCAGAGGGTCTASGSGNIGDTLNLPAGGSVTYTASCTISPSATGSLVNTATATAPGGVTDPTPGNNSATDTDTLGTQADLAVTKTNGVTSVTAGDPVTYTITASNSGPSNVTGATVSDTFPGSLTCTWACVGAAGGTCTAAGSGNINDTVNLPVGGSVTYTVSCTLSAAASGSLSNTATVTSTGSSDPVPANNSATDTDTINPVPAAVVSGTMTVSGAFQVGGSVTYTVTLSNTGTGAQGDNPGDEFTDILPGTLSLVSANATSGTAVTSALPAASATSAESAPVANLGSNTVTWNGAIPAGGSVTITITANILPSAAGQTVSNQGTIDYDADGSGTNEASAPTDDPGAPGGTDPTTFVVAAAFDPSIPTLSTVGLLLLALILAGLAFVILKRRKTA
ncbi:MAG TPA: carboxypeptidase regulatory-like domain-containing protein [Thermoanaerobaculia bacterium]|nr:carboxypeptidase regulatory-like domain-containing protein [Thermoanaerobaculia bacterium]